jgi:hypothetical protein
MVSFLQQQHSFSCVEHQLLAVLLFQSLLVWMTVNSKLLWGCVDDD